MRSIYQLYLNADKYKIIFWFIVVTFVFIGKKNRFCKEFYIPPYPKIVIFLRNHVSYKGSCAD